MPLSELCTQNFKTFSSCHHVVHTENLAQVIVLQRSASVLADWSCWPSFQALGGALAGSSHAEILDEQVDKKRRPFEGLGAHSTLVAMSTRYALALPLVRKLSDRARLSPRLQLTAATFTRATHSTTSFVQCNIHLREPSSRRLRAARDNCLRR